MPAIGKTEGVFRVFQAFLLMGNVLEAVRQLKFSNDWAQRTNIETEFNWMLHFE